MVAIYWFGQFPIPEQLIPADIMGLTRIEVHVVNYSYAWKNILRGVGPCTPDALGCVGSDPGLRMRSVWWVFITSHDHDCTFCYTRLYIYFFVFELLGGYLQDTSVPLSTQHYSHIELVLCHFQAMDTMSRLLVVQYIVLWYSWYHIHRYIPLGYTTCMESYQYNFRLLLVNWDLGYASNSKVGAFHLQE